MKDYCRKALAASVLVLALASSAFAGDIQNPIAQPPPTANGEIQHPVTSEGAMQTGEANLAPEADTLTGIALNLLQSILTLF